MRAENTETVNCPSCGTTLVAGLRFCRRCGYRLGEGVEEYVPTQRFDASSMPTAAPPPPATDPFHARQTWGAAPIQPVRPFGDPSALGGQQEQGSTSKLARMCRPVRGWWLWVTIILLVLIVGGMLPLAMVTRRGGGGGGGGDAPPATSLLREADAYDTADGGGARIRGLAAPGTSLEAAGLVGGDVITHFDGKPVRDADALRKMLAAAGVGRAVEVIFIHDGETKMTTLIPIAREVFRGMQPIEARPNGRGILGVDSGERVRLPNSNIFGVELDDVTRNGPADLAGLKEGDVVFEFNGKPVRTPGDLRLRIYEAEPFSTSTVSVMRGGQRIDVQVKVGRGK
jgi:membrane-associated protease RseP (regulator of RpoE activity)